jgi:hypothetical protein
MDVVFDDPPVELGRGSSGRVFAGKLRESLQPVAVKKIALPLEDASRASVIGAVAALKV